ncbi:MAG: DNA polymerase III subunit beta [Acidobacteria bacterium]|nr:DNA polymerase III subunit beta [Acidobacteriota bacterium]
MRVNVAREPLLSELNLVQGVIEKKTTIPILSNILLEARGGRLDITATDLDVSICCGCAAEVETEGAMTVSARRFFDIVRLLPEDARIACMQMENDWMEIRSGQSEYRVVGLPKENFPSIPEFQEALLSIPGAVMRGMIQRTIFAITQEESRYSLNGALLVVAPREIKMVATDGHRLALVSKSISFDGLDSEIRSLIPRKTLVEIQKLVGDQELLVGFGRDENHLFFSAGDKRLVSRVLAGQFPNYEMVIPLDNDRLVTVPTRAFGDAIRRAAVMSDEKLRAVRFSVSPGAVELTASSAEAGEGKEIVPAEYEGPGLEIGFNPQYLLDFLGVCGSDSVVLALRDADTQGMLRPALRSEFDYRYVVMPMKF